MLTKLRSTQDRTYVRFRMQFLRWCFTWIKWLAKTLWFRPPYIVDPTMQMALELANGLGPPPGLPASLVNMADRVRVMEAIESRVIRQINYFSHDTWKLSLYLATLWMAMYPNSVPGVESIEDRTNILLRLWSGCMGAAKTIAMQTRAGPNSHRSRARIMPFIERQAQNDPIYTAGVIAAPSFKAGREEFYSLRGLPLDSLVATVRVAKWEL